MSHQMSSSTSLPEKSDVQFIPSRLSSGEIALIIPNSVNMNYFSTGSFSLNQLTKTMEQSTSFCAPQPLQSKQIDTSPPLSPTSSISSNDSGLKRTTSDYSSLENSFQTPQKPVPLFATSSSCNSSFEHSSFNSSDGSLIVQPMMPTTTATITATTTTTLQQQHVTSTTEPVGKFENDPANNGNNSMWRPW